MLGGREQGQQGVAGEPVGARSQRLFQLLPGLAIFALEIKSIELIYAWRLAERIEFERGLYMRGAFFEAAAGDERTTVALDRKSVV